MDRRAFAARVAALGVTSPLFPGVLFAQAAATPGPITEATVRAAEAIVGLVLTDAQRARMVDDVQALRADAEAVRALALPNDVSPSVRFDPFTPAGLAPRPLRDGGPRFGRTAVPALPASDTDLAFLSVAELGALVRARRVTSRRLTELALARLRRYDADLKCVVTLLDARALAAADRADALLARGTYLGPLHGIPYGAKDLLAARGGPTTFGTPPFADQVLDYDAEVVRKLDAAGAVLVAKLSLGELAWGDVWTGGRTNSPWNVEMGSSGSSAGSAAAVAAGLVPFAIGSETLGSIVSPSTRCGTTGLRPTYGAVSRAGAMALSWTMDKLGPICRSALDCALVFDAIRGADPSNAPRRDASARDVPFPFRPAASLRGLRIGYLDGAFDAPTGRADTPDNRLVHAANAEALALVRRLAAQAGAAALVPLRLPQDVPAGALTDMLSVEGAAAFDPLVTSGGLDRMVRQTEDAWPHVFRVQQFMPAVQYLQMARARTCLMEAMAEAMRGVDVFLAPSFAPGLLGVTNLTGHPCVVLPHAFLPVEGQPERRRPATLSFIGGLDREAEALRLAHAFQQATDFHRRRPPVGR